MNRVWKVLLGLALVVPMGSYVAGSLAASATDEPTPRHTIVIRDADLSHAPRASRSPSPSTPGPSSSGGVGEVRVDPDDLDDDGDDWGRDLDDPMDDATDDHGGDNPSHDATDDHGGDDHGGSSSSGRGGGGGGNDD